MTGIFRELILKSVSQQHTLSLTMTLAEAPRPRASMCSRVGCVLHEGLQRPVGTSLTVDMADWGIRFNRVLRGGCKVSYNEVSTS